MNHVNNIIHAVRDLLTIILPENSNEGQYKYAFVVHPRSYDDLQRKYPIFRYLPSFFSYLFTRFFWPVIISKVTGLRSQINGKEIDGFIVTVPLTARQMIENRSLALERITQACILAKKSGANIIGLGGLTSSFTRGGMDLLDKVDINITTGHAYTSYNVTQNLFVLVKYMNLDRQKITIGIVGAAGSVGSTSAKIIAREGFKHFVLIDLERKKHHFPDLVSEIKKLNTDVDITISHQIKDINRCDFIIAATNAPEALIKSEDLKYGAIVIDDAQPSDVHKDVFDREDVLVIEAGVTNTPGITSNFNFGLKDRQDNFCCLAEVFALAANEWNEHYVINRASLDLVDEISSFGEKLGFKIAKFQNFHESISEEKLLRIKNIIRKNGI